MIKDWIFVKNFYSPDECDALRNAIAAHRHPSTLDSPAENVVKTSQVQTCFYKDITPELEKFNSLGFSVNKEFFGFDLFQTLQYDMICYNTYDSERNSEYGWHTDAVRDNFAFDIKLTMLLNLSEEEYEGGELMLFVNQAIAIDHFKHQGDALIFPSFIQHCVTPVTAGTRKTCTLFLTGPKWR